MLLPLWAAAVTCVDLAAAARPVVHCAVRNDGHRPRARWQVAFVRHGHEVITQP